MYENEFEKKWREELEEVESEAKKIKLKALVAEATELQRQNDWSGLMGKPKTRLNVLKKEYKNRTGKIFFVPRQEFA